MGSGAVLSDFAEKLLPILPSFTIALRNCLCLVIWHVRAVFPTNMLLVVTFLNAQCFLHKRVACFGDSSLWSGYSSSLLSQKKELSKGKIKDRTIMFESSCYADWILCYGRLWCWNSVLRNWCSMMNLAPGEVFLIEKSISLSLAEFEFLGHCFFFRFGMILINFVVSVSFPNVEILQWIVDSSQRFKEVPWLKSCH
jgi:hypothetical protein